MKNLLITFISIITFGISNAQKAKFGIKGGLNIANLSVSGDSANPTTSPIIGFHVGALLEVKLSDKIALQPELLYSTQGTKFSLQLPIEENPVNVDAQIDFGYINLPLILKYYASNDFCLEAGPQVGFLTSAEATAKVSGRSATEDVKKLFNTNDFGLNFGLGYNFNSNLFIQGRYNLGLSNIGKTEAGDNSKTKNSVFSFSLGYKFN